MPAGGNNAARGQTFLLYHSGYERQRACLDGKIGRAKRSRSALGPDFRHDGFDRSAEDRSRV